MSEPQAIAFRFDDARAAQAAAYLLARHGGKMKYMMLLKLLYLADREMLITRGRTITGDAMYSMKHGPVLSEILDILRRNPFKTVSAAWEKHISSPQGYFVSLLAQSPTDELSRTELKILDKVDVEYGGMDEWKLVDLLHRILPEYEQIETGCKTIEPDRILRLAHVPEDQIAQLRKHARDLSAVDALLQ